MAKKLVAKPIVLNEEQQVVARARRGVYQTLAGAGAGKTGTCVVRLAEIINEGTDPSNVLALSFTSTAAKTLRERVEAITGKWDISRVAGSMTMHSLALKFVEQERSSFKFELAEFPLSTEPIANRLSFEAARKYEIDPRTLRSAVSLYKRKKIRPFQAVADAEKSGKPAEIKMALAYKEYQKKQEANGTLDFDSLMFEMVDLLEKNPEVRSRWQYEYVICDESQDCCLTDWLLLKYLSEKHGNLMCVGDPGQSIYAFRGSDNKLFLNMDEMFPTVQKLFLATNYRSTDELVEYLREIGPVPELAERFRGIGVHGPKPEFHGFPDGYAEANWVVSSVQQMDGTGAVLARTNRALRCVEEALSRENVPYHVVGRSSYWQDPSVKAVLAYTGCAIFPADYLLAGAIRAPFWPSQYLPKARLCARLKEIKDADESVSYWKLLTQEKHSLVESKNVRAIDEFVQFVGSLRRYANLPAAEAVRQIVVALRAVDYLAEEESVGSDVDPVENIRELQKIAGRYSTLKDFLDFTKRASAASKGKRGVGLSTIHSFKGAEADVIWVVGAQEGLIPHAKATDLEEEKRLWFVACSRPRRKLHVCYSGAPSPFIANKVVREMDGTE